MAQFVYDGSDADISSTSLRPQSGPIASRTKPAPSAEMDARRSSEAAPGLGPGPDKDKKEPKESSSKDNVTIEDLSLPKSIITRLAKGVLPPNTQIQANAILAMSKSAIVFINHLSNAANEHTTHHANRKTIMPADVFAALDDIEYPFFRERLEAEFKKFNETQTTKRNTYRRKVAAQKKADKTTAPADPNASMMSTATATTTAEPDTDAASAPRAAKKHKANGAAADDSAMDVDGDETRDASDADTEPEPEQEEEDDEAAEEDEEEEDEGEGEGEDRDEHDRLEDREPRDDHDDALDDGDSD